MGCFVCVAVLMSSINFVPLLYFSTSCFFFNNTPPTEIYTLSLHDALPILAIATIREDLQRERPMDRLLCGDVGYGKTEVAMRAAFKAVDGGYQVAVLAPTTILADQQDRKSVV